MFRALQTRGRGLQTPQQEPETGLQRGEGHSGLQSGCPRCGLRPVSKRHCFSTV
ncbi:hypothetical protein LEMLEM_LOCUS6616 [Lemmus lemmus]